MGLPAKSRIESLLEWPKMFVEILNGQAHRKGPDQLKRDIDGMTWNGSYGAKK